MCECVEVTQDLLGMEIVIYDGEFVQMRDVVHGDDEPRTVLVYVGGTGFNITKLTGHFADSALLNYLVIPEYDEKTLDALKTGAERGGRSLDDIDRPQLVVCSMYHDKERLWTTPPNSSRNTPGNSPR